MGEPLPVESLNGFWEALMFQGNPNSITIEVLETETKRSETVSVKMIEYHLRTPEMASYEPYGISVLKLEDGFWRNGGWVLTGGILGRIGLGDSIVELYGKAIIHRHSYFPFPHRLIPQDTGYEFILLQRNQKSPSTLELGRWKFIPQEVASSDTRSGPPKQDVHASLQYKTECRRAIITITGLNRQFEEQVDLLLTTQGRLLQ